MNLKLVGESREDSFSKKINWQRIAPDNPKFLEIVKEQQPAEDRYLFGLHELKTIEFFEVFMQESPQDKVQLEAGREIIDGILRSSLNTLQETALDLQNPFSDIGLETMLYEATEDEEMKKELLALFPDSIVNIDDDPKQTMIVGSEVAGKLQLMPLNLYRRILEMHIAKHEEKQKNLEKNLPKMKEKFMSRLNKEVAGYGLKISQKRIKDKIDTVKVYAGDFLLYSELTNANGDYNAEKNTVVLPSGDVGFSTESSKYAEYLEEVYTHEMLHALSGLQLLGEDQDGQIVKARIQRMGLLTEGRLRWLNEAVTENLSLKMIGKKNSPIYRTEREILQVIIERGVPEKMFLEAYFEESLPLSSKPAEENALKKLIKKINEKCGDRFLQDLDSAVDRQGVETALELTKHS